LTSKEATDLWRIHFSAVNIYRLEKYKQTQGGRAFYKQEASVMSQTLAFPYDYRPSLQKNGNTTLLEGDHDFLDFNATKHRAQLTEFSAVKVVVIKDAGHNIWTDDPAAFKSALEKALR
jgi:pimeloyl-ACP methyl ester carboxylesterase